MQDTTSDAMMGLYTALNDRLPLTPSATLPDGRQSRGWTLRPDRLNAAAVRFDWIHGAPFGKGQHTSTAQERDSLREDVLGAAARVARQAGFKVKREGLGLLITRLRHSH